MAADVTIFAALLAGLVSFLSPCVLPLVPPYLIYLAGTSLERLAEAEPRAAGAARDRACRAACSWRVSRRCSLRSAPARARSARWCASIRTSSRSSPASPSSSWACIFSGSRRSACSYRQARIDVQKPVGLVGRLCDGARLRARLDAMHRADPGGDPGGRRLQGHGRERRGPAGGLLARARPAVHHRGVGGRAVCGLPRAFSRPSRRTWSGSWAGSWC